MEESGSLGLDDLLVEELKPEGFFDTVDFVCISDNYWLGPSKPCITYGLRGISYYFLEIEGAKMDLHSGVYGGTVLEGKDAPLRLYTLTNGVGFDYRTGFF